MPPVDPSRTCVLLVRVQWFGLICLEQPAVRPNAPGGGWRGARETVHVGDMLVIQDGKVEFNPHMPTTPQEQREAAAAKAARRRR